MVNTAAADLPQILLLRLCSVGNCITDTGPLSPPAAILPFPTLNTGWAGLGLYSYVSAGHKDLEQQTGSQRGMKYGKALFLSSCLFNFYAEYIIRNVGLDESQAGTKIAGRNVNNLRCADDTTLMAESKEELKSLSVRVRDESEKPGLKLNTQKAKIIAFSPITS